MKREYWILLFITLLGLFLRLASLTIGFALQGNLNISVFPDEANFLVSARCFYLGVASPQYIYFHNSLILTPLISGFYSFLGVSAFAGRLLSVVLSTLTIPLTYILGKELFKNEKKALIAALFLTISFIHRFWTMRALADGPLTFFFVLSIFLFVRGIHQEDWRWYLGAAIVTTITVLVKYPGILVYFIIFVYLVIGIYLKKIPKKALIYYLLTIGIFAFIIVTLFLSQFALPFQPLNQISYFLDILFSFSGNPFYYVFYTIFLNVFLAIALFVLFVIIILHSLKQRSQGDILLISWAGVVFVFFSFFGESELYRYLLPAIPALYLLISHFIIDFFNNRVRFLQNISISSKKITKLLVVFFIIGFVSAEIVIGEYEITKRSQTYSGIYHSSQWLNDYGLQNYSVMVPLFAQSQVDFYTGGNFVIYGLSGQSNVVNLLDELTTLNIKYIILSEHFPESLDLPINEILPNYPLNFTSVFSYSDGVFSTEIYEVV